MKLNNKGFAISVIVYAMIILIISILYLLLGIVKNRYTVNQSFVNSVKEAVNNPNSEYRFIEYLESSGTQYINTRVVPTNTMKMHLRFFANSVTNNWYVSGSRENTTSPILFAQSGSTNENTIMGIVNGVQLTANTSGVVWNRNDDGASMYNVTLETKNGVYDYSITNETISKTYTETNVSYTPLGVVTAPIYIFSFNTSDILSNTNKLYEYQLYDNNVLVRNMIPAVRINDSKPGMYDTVNKVFYTNQGTGEFITP